MFKKRLTFKILLFLVLADALETLTQYCFKKSACAGDSFGLGAFSDTLTVLQGAFASPFLWLGLVSVLATFVIWATILSKIDLSVAAPVASFSYITIPVVSIVFLHERISILRWVGIVCILVGVVFVSLSSKEKVADPL